MSRKTKAKVPNKAGLVTVAIRLTPVLDERTREVAQRTGLSQSDIMRMSIERGVDKVQEILTAPAPEKQAA